MFQTSSKSAQHRRSGAGSATAVVLLGAGLACAGQVRADEGTGLEALDTLAATARAGFAAPPAVQAETNNPYLAAASSSLAGWTPASQDQASAHQADAGVVADAMALGTPGASDLAMPPTAQAPSDTPALAAADGGTAGGMPAAQALQGESRGRSDVAACPAPETAVAADVTVLPAEQVTAAAESPRLLAAHGWKKPVAQERLEDLRGGFAAAGRPTPDTFDASGSAGPSAAGEPRAPEARSTMASWQPVAQERLDELRGGFDVGAGLQVSFGIERAVFINGALVVSTSLNIPDVSRITADQASRLAAALGVAVGAGATATTAVNNALAANPVTAGMASSSTGSSGSSSSSSAGTSAGATGSPGTSVTSLPAMAIAAGSVVVTTNGLLNLVQNGPGNSAAAGALAGSPATVIQNTLNNQSIQSLVTINAGVNTLQAFRDQVSGLALTNALLNSASRR